MKAKELFDYLKEFTPEELENIKVESYDVQLHQSVPITLIDINNNKNVITLY